MEIRQLRYFLDIARTEHLTLSASNLFVTQSTLSHGVRQLELGVSLFDRVGRGLRLSQAGMAFRDHAARSIKELEAGRMALSELSGLQTGRLTIGVFPTFLNTLMPATVAAFSAAYPGVSVEVRDLRAGAIEEQLLNGELDFGIAFHPAAHEGIEAEHLFEERLMLVVAPQHPLANRRSIDLKQLAALRLIDDHLHAAGVKPLVKVEIESVDALIGVCRWSLLASIVPERAALQAPDLKALALRSPQIVRQAGILWRRGSSRSAAAREFAALLQPTASEVALCLEAALADPSNAAQIGALLTALAMRVDISHSPHVLLQCRSLMMSHAVPFSRGDKTMVLDIVGTGGDGMDTFNASTAAAMVVASVARDKNVLVAKHGNRSSSGKCGSADFFEAIGGELSVAAAEAKRGGFSFLFAPAFHPAMAAVRQIRRDVGVRTIFNLLGPLMNPALPSHIVLGVSSFELGDDFASVQAALIVHAKNGLDEVSPVGETDFWRIEGGRITSRGVLSVADFGVNNHHRMEAVVGGSAATNASLWRQLIGGASDKHGALLDFVCMNAATALWITGLAPSLKEGTKMAKYEVASGRVKQWAISAGLGSE